jgi:hypothetical protein
MSELMAMISPGAPPFDSVRSTSKSKISACDVAACLVGLDRHTYLYSLSKFALDDSGRGELNVLAVKEARECGFKLIKGEGSRTAELLGLIALKLAISPNKCARCKGVGQVSLKFSVVSCESCNGLGDRKISDRNLANILGSTVYRSNKAWKPRLNELLSNYAQRDSAIDTVIHKGLR